jgi:hypothetical protein
MSIFETIYRNKGITSLFRGMLIFLKGSEPTTHWNLRGADEAVLNTEHKSKRRIFFFFFYEYRAENTTFRV